MKSNFTIELDRASALEGGLDRGSALGPECAQPIADSGYSPVSLLIMSCSIVICTSALVFALFHIRQHPVIVSLLSFFLIRTILDAKVERAVVLDDCMVVISRGVLPWMTRRRVVPLSV